jgi:hypothetical protein
VTGVFVLVPCDQKCDLVVCDLFAHVFAQRFHRRITISISETQTEAEQAVKRNEKTKRLNPSKRSRIQ